MNTRWIALLFVLLWSTGFIGAKLGLPHAEPLTFLGWRYGLVIVLMLPIVLLGRAPWPGSARQLVHIAIAGLLVHGVYLGGVFIAIAHGLPAGVTALVVGLQPVLTALWARAFLKQQIAPLQWLGLLLGFLGVALVVAGKAGGSPPTVAMLLPALLALLGITAGTLYQQRFCGAFDLRVGALIQFLPCLLLTALAAGLTETGRIDWAPDFIIALGWSVLVLSIGAVALLNLLIRRGNSVKVASLFYLTPPVTALIAWLMFGESLGPVALGGMAVTAVGVYLVRRTS